MKERPILFSGAMVRAILSGQKTQTRRVVKLRHGADVVVTNGQVWKPARVDYAGYVDCPYGQPGDRLWVRETHAIVPRTAYRASSGVHQVLRPDDNHDAAVFRADWERSAPSRWRPSIHMPRWACRIVLEIVSVRVERLNDISEADAKAEGILADSFEHNGQRYFRDYRLSDAEASTQPALTCPIESFRSLWESINGHESWRANPWVWAVEFKRVQQ